MSARKPLEEPTVKFNRKDLLRAAREADERARAAEAAAHPSTERSGPPDSEIEVAVEPLKEDLDVDALLSGGEDDDEPTLTLPNDPSDVRRTRRTKENGPVHAISRPASGTKIKP